ncbi:MFS transporter [Pseudoroseomonas globiformis]|uniref:MFS transporter n=1 Tax=Teichococcus globiformis TaxID=2307229 RepID=A0ABV7FTP4_9PROT
MSSTSFRLWPLLFAVLACSMGMMAFTALAGPLLRVLGVAPWQFGLAMTLSGLLWMLMARPWGVASDRLGRKPVLLLGIGGFALAYLAFCAFIQYALWTQPAVWFVFAGLMLGRGAMGGFYAGVPPTSGALVADNTPPERRAAAMATLGSAGALGLVLGPALAAALAPQGLSLPLYGTALLPLVALVVIWAALPATPPAAKGPRRVLRWRDPRLRRPMAVAFTAMLGVANAQMMVGFLALDRLGLPPEQAANTAGIALTLVGVALLLSQALVRRLVWPPARLVRIGGSVAALGFAAVALASTAPALWMAYFVAASGMGFVFPAFAAMAANAVGPQEQGAAAGTVAAAQGCGMVLGPVLGGALYALAPGAPYLAVAAALLLVAHGRPRG